LTARLLVALRPFQAIQEIRGTLGLTDQQYAALASTGAQGTDATSPPTAPPTSDGLLFADTADLTTIIARLGLLALTPRPLVASRPFHAVQQIQGTLGLTDQQYEAIVAAGTRVKPSG